MKEKYFLNVSQKKKELTTIIKDEDQSVMETTSNIDDSSYENCLIKVLINQHYCTTQNNYGIMNYYYEIQQ